MLPLGGFNGVCRASSKTGFRRASFARLNATQQSGVADLRCWRPSACAGARVWLTSGTTTQMRELRVGSNYLSQNPLVAAFGLGSNTGAEAITVRWPSGKETVLQKITANQRIYVLPPQVTGTPR